MTIVLIGDIALHQAAVLVPVLLLHLRSRDVLDNPSQRATLRQKVILKSQFLILKLANFNIRVQQAFSRMREFSTSAGIVVRVSWDAVVFAILSMSEAVCS